MLDVKSKPLMQRWNQNQTQSRFPSSGTETIKEKMEPKSESVLYIGPGPGSSVDR